MQSKMKDKNKKDNIKESDFLFGNNRDPEILKILDNVSIEVNSKIKKRGIGRGLICIVEDLIKRIQEYARFYNKEEDVPKKYEYFMKMQSNLPVGYELTMAVITNYLQLKTIFNQRKNHRLREDGVEGFCKWCISLPHFSELTGCALES